MTNAEVSPEIPRQDTQEEVDQTTVILDLLKEQEGAITEAVQKEVNDTLDVVAKSPAWREDFVERFWNNEELSENDKMALYEGGEPGFKLPFLLPMVMRLVRRLYKYDDKKMALLEPVLAPAVRSLVHLNLLPPPEGLTKEQIAENIKNDNLSVKAMMKLITALVTVMAPKYLKEAEIAEEVAGKAMDVQTRAAERRQQMPDEEYRDAA